MRMTKKILSVVLAVMMVASMMAVMAVASVSAAGAVAKVGETEYTSLSDALDNVPDGGTVTVLQNISNAGTLYADGYVLGGNRTYTVDLGGYTVSGASFSVADGNDVTFTNGTITSASVAIQNAATTTVDTSAKVISTVANNAAVYGLTGSNTIINGTVEGNKYGVFLAGTANGTINGSVSGTSRGLYVKGTGTVDVTGTINSGDRGVTVENGATVNLNDGAEVTAPYGVVALKDATVNVKEGSEITSSIHAISGNGTSGDGGYEININGGTITATGDQAAIYHPNTGELNISGGTIASDTASAIVVKSGSTEITGGTITSEGGEAVKYDETGSGYAPFEEIVVSGGTFSSAVPAEYLANTVDVQPNQSGGYDVVDSGKTYVARVGSDRYETLSAAIAASSNGDTVKLLDNVTETITISAKTLTLDLNGFNITSASKKMVITAIDGTKLTIVNSNTAKAENTPTQNAIMGPSGSNNQGSLNAKGEGTTVDIYAGYYYGYNGNKTAINAINGATVTFWGGTVNGAAGIDDTTAGKEGKVFYSGVSNPMYPEASTPGYIVVHGGTFSGRMSDSNWGNYTIDGGTFDRNEVVINENPVNENGERVATSSSSMTKIKDGTIDEAGWTAAGFMIVPNGDGTYGVGPDTSNPLNPIEKVAADINDGNKFGLTCNYLKGTLLGVQKKEAMENEIEGSSTTSESHQEGQKNIRFVAVLDTQLIQDMVGADDYGFVLAKVGSNKDYSNTNIENLKANWGNGEKTISAKGTYNNVCGDEAYGDPTDASGHTDYKYITCAVNNIDDTSKIVARFYYKKNGVTYYAKYAGHNYQYTGCISTANATS